MFNDMSINKNTVVDPKGAVSNKSAILAGPINNGSILLTSIGVCVNSNGGFYDRRWTRICAKGRKKPDKKYVIDHIIPGR
jgi:hypothetical protein